MINSVLLIVAIVLCVGSFKWRTLVGRTVTSIGWVGWGVIHMALEKSANGWFYMYLALTVIWGVLFAINSLELAAATKKYKESE